MSEFEVKNHIEMKPFIHDYCKRTTLNEVLSVLKSLKENNSVGPDGIPSEVLKVSSSVIGPYLVRLVNESLGQGIFPNCLKTATVKPLFKSDDHQNLNNYKPTSVLPVSSKVFERVVHLNKVATMQRKLLRLIIFKRTGSVETEMINAQILSVPHLYVYEIMNFVFRSIRQEMPTQHMNNLFQREQSNRSSRSENNSKILTPIVCNN